MSKANLKPILMAILSAYAVQHSAYAADAKTLKLDTVDVISTTPLKGLGVPLEQVPSNVQVIKAEDIKKQQSLGLSDFLSDNLNGVNVNETQGNPFQPDFNYHGFSATPLLGRPQGLSVYQDGVRVNEPFGDVVNWDLIPKNAISSLTMMPGSNPVFGLNTLGGALSVQTKSGLDSPGFGIQAYGGSWGRYAIEAEAGGKLRNGAHFFVAGNSFKEDGWRDASPTDVRQLFSKFGWQGEKADFEISVTGADNELTGNGLQPVELMGSLGRKSIYTKPDQTKNQFFMINTKGGYWLSDSTYLSSNVYYRNNRTSTYNGDINDEYATPADASGTINRTNTQQDAFGGTLQASHQSEIAGKENKLTAGATYDRGYIRFNQSEQEGELTDDRGITPTDIIEPAVSLKGKTTTYGVYATDTISLSNALNLIASGRYNHTEVDNKDLILASGTGSLTGHQTFQRFNPAVGLTYSLNQNINFYGGYNEGSRAPSSVEIACSDPAAPCKLPNAMAGDPPTLKQVVAKTWEGGARGKFNEDTTWSIGAYRTLNQNDIQFIAATTAGAGYFQNVGETKRQGFDMGLQTKYKNARFSLGYSFVDATYQTAFNIANDVNSAAVDTDGDGNPDTISVSKGNRLAGIPRHQLKLRSEYDVTGDWTVGANIVAYSSQYVHGNENNADANGKIGSYALLNLDTRYKLGASGWQIFAKVNNVFDREYNTGGMLGSNAFETDGTFINQSVNWAPSKFAAPGAPRAGWIGVRYDFGAKKSISNVDKD